MGSAYTSRGRRIDHHLFLSPDGSLERITRQEPDGVKVDRGRWHHKDGDDVMRLESDTPDELDRISSEWWILSVKTCEKSNCLMVLRWVALASRNLPILFFRVHLPCRWYSQQIGDCC